MTTAYLLLSFLLFGTLGVDAHGMMFAPNDIASNAYGTVRGIEKLSYYIDSLRNPNWDLSVCRNEPVSSKVTDVYLENGQDYTVSLAISRPAEHIGKCYMYVMNKDYSNPVLIGFVEGKYGCTRDSPYVADGDCIDPAGSVTRDMCLQKWTFQVENADKIQCTECVMQFKWTGMHVEPNEPFENCADVVVHKSGSGMIPEKEEFGGGHNSVKNSPDSSPEDPIEDGYNTPEDESDNRTENEENEEPAPYEEVKQIYNHYPIINGGKTTKNMYGKKKCLERRRILNQRSLH